LLRSNRFQITLASSVFALVAFSALALAQNAPNVECKKTETQAECHTRLKCKANEELEDCQKRLLKCTAGEKLDDCKKRVGAGNQGNAGQRNDNQGGNRDDNRGGGDDRGREGGGDDRGREDNRGDDRGRDDNRGDDRGRDRGDDRGRDRGDDRGDDRGRGDRRGSRGRGRGGGGGGGAGSFEANKTFGLGLELGEPTGLNGKLFLSRAGALDFGLGYIYDHYYYGRGRGLHLYADYLWHPISLVHAEAFELPLYIGVGGRFWDFDYCVNRVCTYQGSAIGVRVPVGIAFDFNNVPLDIFIQLVPVLDFLRGDYYNRYGDRAHFGIDLSIGIRFWFK